MAGRHQRAGARHSGGAPAHRGTTRPRRSLLPAAVIALLAVAVVLGTLVLSNARPAARTTDRPTAAAGCPESGSVNLVVQVAPNLAIPVSHIAQRWTATRPTVAGRCVTVELSSDQPDQQELSLLGTAAASTDVWLPDSTVWAQRLGADRSTMPGNALRIAVHPSLASSPLVAVASPREASRLTAELGNPDFDPLAAAALPEPVHNAEGLLSLLSESEPPAAASAGATQALVASLIKRGRSAIPAPVNGFDALTGDGNSTATFVASEQAVIQHNTQGGALTAQAVYPTKPTLSLDFPVVRLSRPGDDPDLKPAADAFEAQLRTRAAQAQFSQAGLRTADGTPVADLGASAGAMPDLVPPATAPDAGQTVAMLRMWNAAVADSSTLAVIDLSGSMADPAGNGQSKVAVATAAAAQAISFFPDTSALGLWVFSSDQGDGTPWAQLVPLGLLSDQVGAGTRRTALLQADASMPARVHGGTALYDTVLAAYQQVRSQYDPSRVNAVVLMTDGRNEDTTSSRTLSQLLNQLKAESDPARPVKVITIGIGAGADAAALSQISAATGGTFYAVRQASDIAGVFLDAVAQRR
jgi:Ca-activated chloride channel family protein